MTAKMGSAAKRLVSTRSIFWEGVMRLVNRRSQHMAITPVT